MFDSPPRYQNQSACQNNHHKKGHMIDNNKSGKRIGNFFSFLEYNGGMLLKVSSY